MGRIDFGPLASRYDEGRALPDWATDPWRDAIVEHAPERVTDLILDVGCGTGTWVPLLASWLTSDVVGVEVSFEMAARAAVTIAESSGAHQLSVMQGSAQRLPVRDASADAAWISNVLHHLDDVGMAARELRRVLQPSGAVLVRTYAHDLYTDDDDERAVRDAGLDGEYLIARMVFPGVRRVLATYPTIDDFDAAFASAGFSRTHTSAVVHGIADDSHEFLRRIELRADTTLQLLDDDEFARGLAELRARVEADPERAGRPVIAPLPFIVYRLP